MWKHYLFVDLESGEEFIVGETNIENATDAASVYFSQPVYQYEMSELEAEMSGLDEY